VTIQNTNINNFSCGIWLNSCNSSFIGRNNVTDSTFLGISLDGSLYNNIGGNIIENDSYGISLSISSNDNSINGNSITNNQWYGIVLDSGSSNVSVSGNTIANNWGGIMLAGSENNTVCHNNFISNTVQTENWYPENVSFWDDGCEGNYWSNYHGIDSNNDGIGNTPYTVDANNIDNYPLMNVYWNLCDINHDLKVNMKDVGISAKAFGTIPGDAKWNPHADITGPDAVPDAKVDMRDISLIAKHFGKRYP
jgi:parallel beta-helix repeat protein